MRISSIEAKNYRQYRAMKYDFKRNKNTDLHIAIAQNGIGKTNFLNAITWCLYGEEAHLNKKSNALPIMNLAHMEDMSVGEIEPVEVSMRITTSSGEFTVTRKHSLRKTGNKENPLFPISRSFSVEENSDANGYKIYEDEDAKNKVNQLFPENIKEYFFFDNEQLDRYFKDNSSEKIKNAVYDISQISLLIEAKKRLNDELRKLRKQLSKNLPSLEKCQTALESAEFELNECGNQIQALTNQIEAGEKRIVELNHALDGINDITGAKEELERKEAELQVHKAMRKTLNQEINSFIRRYLMLLNMYPDLMKTKMVIEKQEDAGNLPPRIDTDYVEKLIQNNKCFIESCSLDDCKIMELKKIIDSVAYSSEVSHLLVEVKSEVLRLIKEAEQYEHIKSELFQRKDEIENTMDDLQDSIDKLKKNISTSGDSNSIELMFKERDALRKQIEETRTKKSSKESHYTVYSTRLTNAKSDFDKEMAKQDKHKSLTTRVAFLEDAANIMEEMEKQIIDEIKSELKNEVYSTFVSLLWKENTFKEVIINEDFSVDLIHKRGYPCLGSCSAAETSLLALAFTLGLHKVSGFDAPIVIDTPVGRVSDVHRENFATALEKVSVDKQIIMFFTPSEYSEEIRKVFDNSYSTLNFIETHGEEESRIGG